ncbi:MAG TPA: cytochrome c oxidase assembly protein [Gemmatimonadaceae bacterium]
MTIADPAVVGPGAVWAAWQWTPSVLVPLAACAAWYAAGVRALWRNAGVGHGVTRQQAACFAGGIVTLAVALLSPVDAMAETLFSVHMVQHLLLILVAAPLLALGEPLLPLVWALPHRRRLQAGRWWLASPRLRGAAWAATNPLGVWLSGLAVLWFWHLPGPYLAALGDERIHAVEHLTFLGTAFLFWWVVFQPLGRRRLARGGAVVYLALTLMQSGALGVILAFARTPWYPAHAAGAAAWHLTLLQDQQLAGLIMSVPASLVYIGVALALAARWFVFDTTPATSSARRRLSLG